VVPAHTNARRDLWGLPDSEAIVKRAIDALRSAAILDPACGSGAFPMGMLQLLLKTYERLDPEFKTFADKRGAGEKDTLESRRRAAKLAIIQNNLYGVDIEEMAVEIARLRAWLSIVVDEENVRNVRPLPNLDFKFVRGNGLLSVDKEDLWNAITLEQLEKLKEEYFRAFDTQSKIDLSYRINNILKTLSKDGVFDFKIWFSEVFRTKKINHEPHEPHEQNGGFDIVLGNPPYGASYPDEHKKAFKEKYQSAKTIPGIQKGSLDTFSLFIERGFNLLRKGGGLDFIVPLSVVSSDSMTGLHNILLNNCEMIRVSSYAKRPVQIFSNACTANTIINFRKDNAPCKNLLTTKMNRLDERNRLQELMDNLQLPALRLDKRRNRVYKELRD